MDRPKDQLHFQLRLHQPSGWLISVLTFPLGVVACTMLCVQCWNLFREIYCRFRHNSAPVLCHFIDWDFRPDLPLVIFVAVLFYATLHFWRFRRIPLQRHLALLVGLFIACVLVMLVARLLPGEWEAWYGAT